MSEIYVAGSSQIQSVIDELTTDNGKFLEKTEALAAEAKALAAKWEGDASEAFQTHFTAQQAKYQAFHEGIAQYITALQQILQKYEQAEQTNTTIANN